MQFKDTNHTNVYLRTVSWDCVSLKKTYILAPSQILGQHHAGMDSMAAEDQYTGSSGSEFTEYWVDWFLGMKGNEYFCDIDVEYIKDRFNLTGLNAYVEKISLLIDLVTDAAVIDENQPQRVKDRIEENCKIFYGLIHARFIITARGLSKMLEKYKSGHFGYCPRVLCNVQPLLPIGMTDNPGLQSVKLYCAHCEDLYQPKSSRHAHIDGAFFGTSFPGMFLQNYPELVPVHRTAVFKPRIFGFQVHDHGKLNRWRQLEKQKLIASLIAKNVKIGKEDPGGFYDELDNEDLTTSTEA